MKRIQLLKFNVFKLTYVLLRCSTAAKQRKKILSYKNITSGKICIRHKSNELQSMIILKLKKVKSRNNVPNDSLASPSWLRTAKSLRTRAWSWNTLTTKLYCCPISSKATINASSICQKTNKRNLRNRKRHFSTHVHFLVEESSKRFIVCQRFCKLGIAHCRNVRALGLVS